MTGRRLYCDDDGNFFLDEARTHLIGTFAVVKPGDYWRYGKFWSAMTPDGRLANISGHTITTHADDTISVSPSILVSGGGRSGSWHGFLEHGQWREC